MGFSERARLEDLNYVRWGIPREPAWINGEETTAPGAGTALVSKTVSDGKKGRVLGFYICIPEANDFRLYSGATMVRRFSTSSAGLIWVESKKPIIDNISPGTEISIKNVNAGGAGKVYQANLLYDES